MSRIQSGRAYILGAGADPEDPAAWVEIGAVRSDGYRPAPSTPEARHDYEAPASTSFSLQMPMTPRIRQLLFGNIAPPATPPFKGLREAIERMRRNRVQESPDVLTTALADPEGQALVQGIIDRKQGLLSP